MFKDVVLQQYQAKVEQTREWVDITRPKEGWIRTIRKALRMSGQQLAKRLGVGKAQVSQMELGEVDDRITLKQLRRAAEALDCTLTYALIPNQSIQTMIETQALKKAKAVVTWADTQMKLEAQQLSEEKLAEMIEREVKHLVQSIPRDLWDD